MSRCAHRSSRTTDTADFESAQLLQKLRAVLVQQYGWSPNAQLLLFTPNGAPLNNGDMNMLVMKTTNNKIWCVAGKEGSRAPCHSQPANAF